MAYLSFYGRRSAVGMMLALLAGVSIAAPPSDAGKAIATQGNGKGATACTSCHGEYGEGNAAAGFPRVGGMNADYLAKQLRDFRSRTRDSAVMGPVATALSDADIGAVSRYYAGLKWSAAATQKLADNVAQGAVLARYGDWPGRALPACSQCHAENGLGVGGDFPPVAGQHASYIAAQLKAWKTGTRHNDPLGLMKSVAAKLSEEDMQAVAAYYAAGASNAADVPAKGQPHAAKTGTFTPPPRSAIPSGPFGDAIRRGEAIFRFTNSDPVSKQYVGNDLQCENCHLDAGRLANSSPMWAAYVSYPAYRAKNKKVNTIIERLQGCFSYSMNGPASKARKPPAADSDVMVDLVSYMYWLASGAATGDAHIAGRGYPKLKETQSGFDPKRGEKLYAQNCAVCHGTDGQGRYASGQAVFPPLWGPRSYNWGAGMHAVDTLAEFVKANMPLGLGGSLSDQDAWDVAAFVNSHERAQDPRYKASVAETRKLHHDSKFDLYGSFRTPSGKLLGEASPRAPH